MGKVVSLNCITTLDIPTDGVLEGAIGKLETVVVVGFQPDGKLYLASNTSKSSELFWLLEIAKRELLDRADYDK